METTISRRQFGTLATGFALAGATVPAWAQGGPSAYPSRPIRLVVAGGPGSGSDITARLVAAKLATALKQPIVIENRPGAGGMMASDVTAKSAPDGLTWTILSSAATAQAAISKKLPFDPVKDFSWISTISSYPIVFSVAADSQITDFSDLVRRAKVSPGQVTYTSSGVGSAYHLMGEWLSSVAAVEMLHVPFKAGTGPLVDVLAKRLDVLIDSAAGTMPHVHSGKLRAIAVSSATRSEQLPNVPALSEFYPELKYESWLALVTAAHTPPAIVARLNAEMKAVLSDPDMQARLAGLASRADPASPEDTRRRAENDIARSQRIVLTRNIERS